MNNLKKLYTIEYPINKIIQKFLKYFDLMDYTTFISNQKEIYKNFSFDEIKEICLYLYQLIKKENKEFDNKNEVEKFKEIVIYCYYEMPEDIQRTGLGMFVTGNMNCQNDCEKTDEKIYKITNILYFLIANVIANINTNITTHPTESEGE